MYKLLRSLSNDRKTFFITKTKQTLNKVDLWHQQYDHLRILSLQKLQVDDMVVYLDIGKHVRLKFCKRCVYGKHHCDNFPKESGTNATKLLELIFFCC